jgi:uncharacterized membrane protein YfcA
MPVEWERLVVITAAVGAGALVKGATGMGLPLVAMPVLVSAFGLPHAISLMIIPIFATNAAQVWRFRRERSDPKVAFLLPMILASLLGVAVGTLALVRLDERILSMALGLLLLGYVALRLLRPGLVLDAAAGQRAAVPAGFAAGVLQGSTGISSPVVVTFIHAMGFGYAPHVFAVSTAFLMMSVAQFPALFVSGVLRAEWLLEGVIAVLPILGLVHVGQRLGSRISRTAFDRLILAFLAFIGLKLVFAP